MRVLICDTETSCLNDKRIVQLACILVVDGKEVACLNTLIRPDGWTIDPRAQEVHGISLGDCERGGVGIAEALWLFDSLSDQADVVISHNYRFDSSVIHGEYARLEKVWNPKASFCTMLAMTPICKLPSKFRGQFKWPKLSESHIWAFGEDFENQHDAMSDVRACHRIYQYLVNNNHIV